MGRCDLQCFRRPSRLGHIGAQQRQDDAIGRIEGIGLAKRFDGGLQIATLALQVSQLHQRHSHAGSLLHELAGSLQSSLQIPSAVKSRDLLKSFVQGHEPFRVVVLGIHRPLGSSARQVSQALQTLQGLGILGLRRYTRIRGSQGCQLLSQLGQPLRVCRRDVDRFVRICIEVVKLGDRKVDVLRPVIDQPVQWRPTAVQLS